MRSKETVAAYKRDWARQNCDPVEEARRQKEWRQKNPERARAIKRRSIEKAPALTRAKWAEEAARWRKRNPDKARDGKLRATYGIGLAERDAMEANQGGLCAICGGKPGSAKKLHIDHDHSSGKIRGLLCGHCNAVLGYARDSMAVLHEAIVYLRRHQQEEESRC